MNNKEHVPQSYIIKGDDPREFLEQQKKVIRMLNDIRPQCTEPLTLGQYQKDNGIIRVYGYE